MWRMKPWSNRILQPRQVWQCRCLPMTIMAILPVAVTVAKAQGFVLQSSQTLALAPALEHTVWVAQRQAATGGSGKPWDKVGLHRLLRYGQDPQRATVVFFLPGMNSSGEQILADGLFKQVASSLNHHPELPPERLASWRTELKSIFRRSTPHVLAEAGYAVYAMDYRTHFVPSATRPGKLSFMRHWGWAMFLDDIATAIEAAKKDSGAARVVLAAESLGGLFALNDAACCAQQDIAALVLIDGGDGGRVQLTQRTLLTLLGLRRSTTPGGLALVDGIVLPRVLQGIVSCAVIPLLHATATYATDMGKELATTQPAMWTDPLARPIDPATGKPLPEATYVDWAARRMAAVPFHLFTAPGQNTPLGLAGIWASFDRYFPLQVVLESMDQLEFGLMVGWRQPGPDAMSAGFLPHGLSFAQGYSNIQVPTIGFLSHFGLTLWGPWNPQLGSRDVTMGGAFPDMGHLDMYIGTNTAQRISTPLLNWLAAHHLKPQRAP